MPLFLIASLLLAIPTFAEDDAGKFAIKGGGLQNCAALIAAYDAQSSDIGLYAGWIDGYLTGLNQFTPDTYDFAAWQGSDTLLSITHAVCKQMPPQTLVMEAFFQVIRSIQPGRIQTEEDLIALVHEGKGTAIYGSVLVTAKKRLKVLGYDPGSEDTSFDEIAATAIRAFQKANSIPETGLPDQQTLYILLRN